MVGIKGIFQPFADAVKLLTNELFLIYKSNVLLFYISPFIGILLSLIIWILFPFLTNLYSIKLSILLILCFLRITVYSVMLGGWSSNSNYSILGCIRSVAQSISYEVRLIIILISLILLIESYSFCNLYIFQQNIWFIFLIPIIFLILLIRLIAELNRTPFDLVEGESELVSGFNTEYFRGRFAVIFIAEYAIIIFSSGLIVLLFMGIKIFSLLYIIILIIFINLIIWIRGILPRIRYDQLINLCWKVFLPNSLLFLIFNFFIKININLLIY